MRISRLDIAYRKVVLTKFFTKGWGSPQHLIKLCEFRKVMSNRDTCYKLIPQNPSIDIINQTDYKDFKVIDGKFRTPLCKHLEGIVPEKVEDAYFQLILPMKWLDKYKPVCIHLAGTGDHYFWRRRNLMAKPLLKKGIGGLILENPYYGLRKPDEQTRSCLQYVSDIFVMGACLILECLVLLKWLEDKGFGPLALTGLSMGGHMASLAATNWPKPIALIPCLSWSTASSVFTEGVMSESIDWDMLQHQYTSNSFYCSSLSRICQIVDNPFASSLGKLEEAQKDLIWEDLDDISAKTPFELLNLMNSSMNREYVFPEKYSMLKAHPLTKEILMKVSRRERMKRDKEALWFMRGIMDELTHLKHFSIPVDTSLIIVVCANLDGYVPRAGLSNLADLWPGITVRFVRGGHIGAVMWQKRLFRKCIHEAIERAKRKVQPPDPTIYAFK